jgi:hypothetical protein
MSRQPFWGGLQWLFGLAHSARVEEKFIEVPIEKRLILAGRLPLKRLCLLDKLMDLLDQFFVFESIHRFAKLAGPALPLEQGIVVKRAAEFPLEFGSAALVGEALSNRSQTFKKAVQGCRVRWPAFGVSD